MMVPDPMCPNCRGEFVEKIESDNDPRTFIQPNPQNESGGDGQQDAGFGEPLNLEDLLRVFQFAMQHQQQQQQPQRSGQMFGGGTSFVISSGPMGTTFSHSSGPPSSEQPQTMEAQTDTTSENTGRDGLHQQPQGPPSFLSGISGLLSRLGIEFQYTTSTDPAVLQGTPFGGLLGGMGGGGSMGSTGLFPLVGNPGDYAWGQGGLDDIITRMMELQSRQNGPVGATDEIIDNIPHHKLTSEELEAKTECSVCKDEFNLEDNLLQLPCKHIFHEDCIKPWLKVSGTCPTCRFSLVSDNNHSAHPGDSPSGSGGHDSTTRLPGAFPTSANTGRDAGNNSNSANDEHQGNDGYPVMESLD
ncbi:hypothetical protein BGX26_004262 [Mortierella sp. AD094]|nr:hypothetical protein BGX26_004262 [Mortierella sp. AD094]